VTGRQRFGRIIHGGKNPPWPRCGFAEASQRRENAGALEVPDLRKPKGAGDETEVVWVAEVGCGVFAAGVSREAQANPRRA